MLRASDRVEVSVPQLRTDRIHIDAGRHEPVDSIEKDAFTCQEQI